MELFTGRETEWADTTLSDDWVSWSICCAFSTAIWQLPSHEVSVIEIRQDSFLVASIDSRDPRQTPSICCATDTPGTGQRARVQREWCPNMARQSREPGIIDLCDTK
jgi:hypothetical protein